MNESITAAAKLRAATDGAHSATAARSAIADSHAASETLSRFAAELRFEQIPAPVVRRAEDLFVDWLGSALAGKDARPVETIARFYESMGPADVHNGSVFHPAAVVFPPALAVAQALGSSGAELLCAVVVGYEVGIRVGEFLGRSHYKVFHTTGTAGTLAAAAAVGRLLRLSPEAMRNAFGSAGTQAAGLWEFLRDAAETLSRTCLLYTSRCV